MKIPFITKSDAALWRVRGFGNRFAVKQIFKVSSLFVGLSISMPGLADTCADHCGKYSGVVQKMCEKYKGVVDPWVAPLVENGVSCDCPCSCVVLGTLILTPSGETPIEMLRRGNEVTTPLTLSESGKIRSALSSPVAKHAVRKVTTSAGEVTVSRNHLFVTPNRKVISAEKLQKGMKILDGSNQEVTVESNDLVQKYTGSLHNLVLRQGNRRIEDHVYVANNLQSGDLVLQDANDRLEREVKLRLGQLPYIQDGKIIDPKIK